MSTRKSNVSTRASASRRSVATPSVAARRRATYRRPAYPRVSGRGGYWYVGGQGSASVNLGRYGKASLGVQGGYANKQMSRQSVSGKGAYVIKRNVLYEGAQIPEIRNARRDDGAVVIRHSEYICDVISSSTIGAFSVQAFPINAGLAQIFEYLAQIAGNFTEYRIEGMLFEFRTRSVDALNSTNTALGSVYIATQYNSLEPDFSSKAEMSSYQYCNNCKPSESMIHIIECDPKQTAIEHLYIRTGSVPATADIRLYDLGRLQVATQGMQAASVNIGELHVTYQVALYKPRLYQSLGYLNDIQEFYNAAAACSPGTPLGLNTGTLVGWTTIVNNMPADPAGYASMVLDSPTNNAFSLSAPNYPMGIRLMYRIQWTWPTAQTMAAGPFSLTPNGANAVDLTGSYFPGSLQYNPEATTSSSTWGLNAVIDYSYGLPRPLVTVQYNGTWPTATAVVSIAVIQVPNTN